MDAFTEITFTTDDVSDVVRIAKPITVGQWVRWHLFVLAPATNGDLESAGARGVAWVELALNIEMADVVKLCNRHQGVFNLGITIIHTCSFPKELGVREWMDVTYGATDFNPSVFSKHAPCHCFYCRRDTDERDETCNYFGKEVEAGIIADIDLELAWSMWDAPLVVYQIAESRHESNKATWDKYNLREQSPKH